MADGFEKTDITTIARGAIPELFHEQLCRVMDNIDDLNTEAKAKRSISIDLSFEPDASRQAVTVKVSVRSKLAAPKKAESTVFVVRDGSGEVFAVNNNVHQPELFKG